MSDSTNIQAIYNALFDPQNGMQARLERIETDVKHIDQTTEDTLAETQRIELVTQNTNRWVQKLLVFFHIPLPKEP